MHWLKSGTAGRALAGGFDMQTSQEEDDDTPRSNTKQQDSPHTNWGRKETAAGRKEGRMKGWKDGWKDGLTIKWMQMIWTMSKDRKVTALIYKQVENRSVLRSISVNSFWSICHRYLIVGIKCLKGKHHPHSSAVWSLQECVTSVHHYRSTDKLENLHTLPQHKYQKTDENKRDRGGGK